jgi:gliding motility-associated-like protein
VGATSDATDCLNQNWYNTNSVTYLTGLATVKNGWTGNSHATVGSCAGGSGSRGWVIASHCMPYLAHVASVKFRITFGAGTICNDFDGIAFDNIYIGNAPSFSANFGYSCLGANNVAFFDSSSACMDTWYWNFGDTASGATNISRIRNPSHQFSHPGVYQVTMIDSNSCTSPVITTKTVTILGGSIQASNVSCFGGNDGSAIENVSVGSGVYQYIWNTVPPQDTRGISGLSAGTYIVNVSQSGSCPCSDTVLITHPTALNVTHTQINPSCSSSNGSIHLHVTGGIAPYQFIWLPAVSITDSAGSLSSGTYIIAISDSHACQIHDTVSLINQNGIRTSIFMSPDTCHTGKGLVYLQFAAGARPSAIQWIPALGIGDSLIHVLGGQSILAVITDSVGCNDSLRTAVGDVGAALVNLGPDTAICKGTSLLLNPGSFASYHWQDGSSAATFQVDSPGIYFVIVMNTAGCSASDSVIVRDNCGEEIAVPMAFTPNGDGTNDVFGPFIKGNINHYKLLIYDRWGVLVFESEDVSEKWNGTYKGKDQMVGVYDYLITYNSHLGEAKIKKGNVSLLR